MSRISNAADTCRDGRRNSQRGILNRDCFFRADPKGPKGKKIDIRSRLSAAPLIKMEGPVAKPGFQTGFRGTRFSRGS
ncbi:MAG: hypothetical protein V8S69_07325 [Dakarella massiliensis]